VGGIAYHVGYFDTEQEAYEAGQRWWKTTGVKLFEQAYGEPY